MENEPVRYEDSEIDERIIRAVKEMGFESMTPIQQEAIPALLTGEDIIGQAQTGTGKTAAFGIPMIQMIDPEVKGTQCIILCPTRELAIQAAEEIRKYARYMPGIKVLPIYGGQDISKQIRSLSGNVSIVVGTPGRVMDHMRRHTLKMKNVKAMVLDEADEMLNMGFREDIETVLAGIPQEHQTALFSATMPKAILDITHTYQKADAKLIQIQKKELTIPLVKQYYYEVKRQNKAEVCARLLDYYNPKLSLIFCNTKRMVDDLAENLKGRGYFAEGLHGDLSQAQRDKVMNGFRNGSVEILIATDVAARGIDVDDVEAVFNYDVPQDIEYYVHRIGRTGRAGRTGRSFTLVVGREIYKIRDIERVCHTKIKARTVPSAADITAVKSEKIFTEIAKTIQDSDLSQMLRLIEEKLNEEDYTALDLAAAFLKQQMGEEIEDIPVEEYKPGRRSGFSYQGKGNGRDYGKKDGDSWRPAKYKKDGEFKKDSKFKKDKDGKRDTKYKKDGFQKKDGRVKKDHEYGKDRDYKKDGDYKKEHDYNKDGDYRKEHDYKKDGDYNKEPKEKKAHKEKLDVRQNGSRMVKTIHKSEKGERPKKDKHLSFTEYAKGKNL